MSFPAEVTAVLTLHALDELALRIEQAYVRRHPHWRQGCSNPRVWATAAAVLVQVHRRDAMIPIDPELYVASQPPGAALADPWADLAQRRAARCYRRQVRRIIRKLRAELRAELQQAAGRLQRGEAVEAVLLARSHTFSPLGRYIVAFRAGRPELAERFRSQAQDQHRSCPLYRQACLALLPARAYPVLELIAGLDLQSRAVRKIPHFSLN